MSEDYLAQQPIAMWNPARGVWEIPMENILCEHWGLFSATFPTSGMMRGGKLFPLPLLAHRTDVSAYSSLPTPTVSDQYTDNLASSQQSDGSMHSVTLAQIVNRPDLLPTPTAQAAKHGSTPDETANSHGSNLWDVTVLFPTPNTMDMLPARTGEARERQLKRGDPNGKPRASSGNLRETVVNDLLPTPTVVDLGNNKTIDEGEAWTDEQRVKHGNGNGHGASLSIEAQRLLPTTMASMKGASKNEIAKGNPKGRLEVEIFLTETWGKFAPAIHQWETITGNPAPPPTIPDGRDGQARLNPQFAEWMMGLPPGWITDCDITRNEQLKACGNGVVPQQATLAITRLLQGVTL